MRNKFVSTLVQPKELDKPNSIKPANSKSIHIINARELEKETALDSPIFALVARETCQHELLDHPLKVYDVFSASLPNSLPPMRDIELAFEIVPEATLPNLPHYHLNLKECDELKWQIDELLAKVFLHEILNPCIVSALLTHKKIGLGACVLIAGR